MCADVVMLFGPSGGVAGECVDTYKEVTPCVRIRRQAGR